MKELKINDDRYRKEQMEHHSNLSDAVYRGVCVRACVCWGVEGYCC